MRLTSTRGRITISLCAIRMGRDWTVAITGGDQPHLGAAALGIPRPSLSDPHKRSASVSVLTVTGHKEDELARRAAYDLASLLDGVVLVSCGIHVHRVTASELQEVQNIVGELTAEAAAQMMAEQRSSLHERE